MRDILRSMPGSLHSRRLDKQFWAVQDEHLELRRGHIEQLGDALANPMLETATAWAGLVVDINGDLFARQMRRQRAAIYVSLARQSQRLGCNQVASAFALTYILRLRPCKSLDAFVISSLPS